MLESTPGMTTGSSKRKLPTEEIDGKEGFSPEPQRLRLCLRAVVEALSEWRMHTEDLVFSDDIDRKGGGSADLAKATISNLKSLIPNDRSSRTVKSVAVKKFRFGGDIGSRAEVASFANELNLLSDIKHDNVVEFIGFVENAVEGIAWILLGWEDNGNLREFIHSQDWVIPECLSLIFDVICGVEYLHTIDPPICHGDLKSLNILVTSQNRAVITDFGSARKLELHQGRKIEGSVVGPAPPAEPIMSQVENHESSFVTIDECGTSITLTGPTFTLRWAAPELLYEKPFTLASDMWAVAWICWEVMTGKLPFDDVDREALIVLNVTRGNLPPVTSNEHISQLRALCATMTGCWSMKPTKRPTAGECRRTIGWMGRIVPARRNAIASESYPVEVLCALGYTSFENLETAKAASYFETALKVARSAQDELAIANAMMGRGTVYGALKQYFQAEGLYIQAKEIYVHHGTEKLITGANFGLAQIYRMRREYAKAEASYIQVKDACLRLGVQKGVADAIWGLGQLYRSQSEFSKAQASYTEAREIYGQLGAEKDVAHASCMLGRVYLFQREYSKAQESYAQAKKIYSHLGMEKGVSNCAWGLQEIYHSQHMYSNGNTSSAEAWDIASCLRPQWEVANTSWWVRDVNCLQDNNFKAEAPFTNAEEPCTRLEVEEIAKASWRWGEVYCLQGKYSKAEAQYINAKELYASVGANRYVADAAWALGKFRRSQEKYSKAEASFIEAKEIYAHLGANEVANTAWELGTIYHLQGEYSNAEAMYTEAKELYACDGAKQNVAKAGCMLGHIYRLRGMYPKAEALYTAAKEVYADIGAERDVARTRCELGQIYRLQGEYFMAEVSYTKAKEIYTSFGLSRDAEKVARTLEDIYHLQDAHIGASQICANLGAKRDVADMHCQLGKGYRQQGEYFKAEVSYMKAKNIYICLGAEKDAAKAGCILGDIYLLQNRLSEAEALYIHAKEIYSRLGDEAYVANVGSRLTEVRLSQKQHFAARAASVWVPSEDIA